MSLSAVGWAIRRRFAIILAMKRLLRQGWPSTIMVRRDSLFINVSTGITGIYHRDKTISYRRLVRGL